MTKLERLQAECQRLRRELEVQGVDVDKLLAGPEDAPDCRWEHGRPWATTACRHRGGGSCKLTGVICVPGICVASYDNAVARRDELQKKCSVTAGALSRLAEPWAGPYVVMLIGGSYEEFIGVTSDAEDLQ